MDRNSHHQHRLEASIVRTCQLGRAASTQERTLHRQAASVDLNRRASVTQGYGQSHTRQGVRPPVPRTSPRIEMSYPTTHLDVGNISPKLTCISTVPASATHSRIETSRCVRRVPGTPSLFSQFSAGGELGPKQPDEGKEPANFLGSSRISHIAKRAINVDREARAAEKNKTHEIRASPSPSTFSDWFRHALGSTSTVHGHIDRAAFTTSVCAHVTETSNPKQPIRHDSIGPEPWRCEAQSLTACRNARISQWLAGDKDGTVSEHELEDDADVDKQDDGAALNMTMTGTERQSIHGHMGTNLSKHIPRSLSLSHPIPRGLLRHPQRSLSTARDFRQVKKKVRFADVEESQFQGGSERSWTEQDK